MDRAPASEAVGRSSSLRRDISLPSILSLTLRLLVIVCLLRGVFITYWVYQSVQIISPLPTNPPLPTLIWLPCSGQDLGLYLVQRSTLKTQLNATDFEHWLAEYQNDGWRVTKSVARGTYQIASNVRDPSNTLVELNPIISIYRSRRTIVAAGNSGGSIRMNLGGEAFVAFCVKWSSGLCIPINQPASQWVDHVVRCVAKHAGRTK